LRGNPLPASTRWKGSDNSCAAQRTFCTLPELTRPYTTNCFDFCILFLTFLESEMAHNQNRKMEERRKEEEAADGEGLKNKEKTKKGKEGQSIRAELMDLRYGWGLIMHNFLSPSECKQMIDRTEDIGYKPNDRVERISDCGRVTFIDKSLADKLWGRVEPFLPPVIQPGNWKKKGTTSFSGQPRRRY